ncbi:PQQ-binding-like beta-propeller repeat protein [Gaetbulibacter sp. M235]|uniref:outer membrane protein assembly factor BamB family protein n=1 Tax=Gaetbulibacter sp. M235 TaxID=3126510 RepID=UPI00374EFDFD
MSKKVVIWLFLIIALKCFSQSTTEVEINDITIGKNNILQNEIIAKEYTFEKRIHHSYFDSITGYATLELRKLSKNGKIAGINGLIVVFDLNTKNVKWTKKIDYSTSSIKQYNDIIIFSKANKTIRLNIEDGTEMWEIKNDFYYVDYSNKIAIGYKNTGLAGNIHTLEGIDLTNGTILWSKELKRDYGWNKIYHLNDNDLLIVSGGLHRLNVKDGQGWDYETVTGKKDYTETIAKNVGGIALGLLTGTYLVSTGSNVVTDVVSNAVIDSTNIYMASKEQLICLKKDNGSVIWSYQLPKDSTSKSSLIIQDSSLLLINQGYAYWRNRTTNFGEPFILKMNKTTGKEVYFKTLNQKDNPLYDYKTKNDSLLALFKGQIVNYSLSEGLSLQTKTFSSDTYGDLKFFVGNNLYKKIENSDSNYVTVNDSINSFVQTSKGKTLKIDKDFNVIEEYDFDNLYLRHSIYKNHTLLNQKDVTIILDSNNKPVAELNVSFDSLIIGDKLYDLKDNKLLEINLTEILNATNESSF